MLAARLLALAWRNLGRHRRRTVITALAIGVGLALLVVSSALGDGVHGQMIQSGVSLFAGHVVVQGPGYQEEREPEQVVEDAAAVSARLAEVAPEAVIVPRVFIQGLLSSARGSVGVQVAAVLPELEAQVNDLSEKIVLGTYLRPGDPQGIVLGDNLAESLAVDPGDKVVLMTQRGPELESRLFRVRGLFHSGLAELDGFYAQIPLEAGRALLGREDVAHQLAVHLPDAEQSAEVTALARSRLAGQPLEVLPWQEALPELHQFVILDDASLYVFILIIALIVALGITNTVLMSVLERVREFGVLLSLGMTPLRLAGMVLAEALFLGLASALGGSLLGALLAWPLAVYGLDYSAMVSEGFETAGVMIEPVIYGDLSWTKVAIFAVLTVIMTLLAALYPTWKALRLRPVEAMHHA